MRNDYSFLLKLESMKLPGVSIKRIPGVEIIKYTSNGTFYGVSYFVVNKFGTIKHRFLSVDRNFKTLHSMEFYDQQLIPGSSIEFSPDMPSEKFKQVLAKIFTDGKHRNKQSKIEETSKYTSEQFIRTILHEMDEQLAVLLPNLIILGLTAIMMIAFWIRKAKNKFIEKQAETTLEIELNKKLFVNQTGKESAFDIYSNLVQYINFIIKGKAKALIICGPPGMSKTYMVRRVCHFARLKPGQDYIIAKGSTLGLKETYALFYEYRDKIVILDDFDTPLKNDDTVNMLKAITDSYDKRILSLPREKLMSSGQAGTEESSIPQKFEFTGKLIIITNMLKKDLDRALLSRAPAIEVSFNTEECLNAIQKMMEYINPDIPMEMKQEVFKYIMYLKSKDKNINVDFRGFKSAIEARYGVPDGWKEMAQIIVNYHGN